MSRAAKPSMTDAQRRDAYAKVHNAKKQLGLDEDTYRALLKRIGGAESAKALSDAGLDAVLAHFRQAGAVFKNPRKAGHKPHVMHRAVETRDDQLRKIEALLTERNLPWRYLIGPQTGANGQPRPSMLQRLTGLARLEWCDHAQLAKVIAALAIQQRREARHE